MSLMLGSSIRFIFPSPPVLEFVAAAILLFNSSLYIASYGLSTRLPLRIIRAESSCCFMTNKAFEITG